MICSKTELLGIVKQSNHVPFIRLFHYINPGGHFFIMAVKYPYKLDPKKRPVARRYARARIAGYLLNNIAVTIAFLYVFLQVPLQGFAGTGGIAAYAFIFLTLLFAAQLPLRFYLTYVYEHKYGLSNYRMRGWAMDYLKGIILAYVFTIPVITALYLLTPLNNWWIYAGIGYFFANAFSNLIYPEVVTPFFYKLKPYNDRKHVTKILLMMKSAGVGGIKGIFVADESSKSKKPNAMFAGFGGTKRIVLFDTLLRAFSKDEVETVIAHEIGHYVNRDVHRFIILDTVKMFIMLFVIDSLAAFYGVSLTVQSLPFMMFVYVIMDFLAMPLINSYSRHREYKADLFALRACKKKTAQISTEKRLADMSLSHVPHPVIEMWFYSHPNFMKRIKMCEKS